MRGLLQKCWAIPESETIFCLNPSSAPRNQWMDDDEVPPPPQETCQPHVADEPTRRATFRLWRSGQIAAVAVLGAMGLAAAMPCQMWTSRDEPYPIGTVVTVSQYQDTLQYELSNYLDTLRYEIIQYQDTLRYELKQALPDGRTGPDGTLSNGNWVPTQRRCTDLDAHGFPATFDQRLRRFSLWTNRTMNLNDRVQLKPWWFGSNHGPVNLGAYSDVMGNLRDGGDLNQRSFGKLWGEAWRSGHFTTQSPGGIDAVVYKPTLTNLVVQLPERVFAGGADKNAEPGDSLDLPLGVYGAVTVKSRATLILHGGEYEFTSLTLEPQAKVRVVWDTTWMRPKNPIQTFMIPLKVHVRDEIWCKQEVKFDLQNGNASDILWMVYGTGGVFVGSAISANTSQKAGVGFHGTVIAPKSKVEIASDGVFTGTIYADELEVHQANRFLTVVPFDNDPRTLDSDGDGLADSTEQRIGTDPSDMDTDEDGLSDALELWGRGFEADGVTPAHRFGAERTMKACRDAWIDSAKATHPCHRIDGYIPALGNLERLHPARRDVALRLFWEPESAFWRYSSDLTRPGNGRFEECYADSEANRAMAASFSDVTHFHAVPDSDVVAVPYLNIALHLDAGAKPGASVNMPPEVERMGGERIVASGGVDTGIGLWNYDHPEDSSAIPNRLSMVEIDKTLQGMGSAMPHSRSFWDIFRYGFMTYDNDQNGYGQANGVGGDYFFIGWKGVMNRANVRTVMHELGHDLHLYDVGTVWIYEGVMNYAYPYALGCTPDKWDPVTGKGSVDNKRWCGELPPKDTVPVGYPRAGQEWYHACDPSSPFFLRDSLGKEIWTCDGTPNDYGNRGPIPSDLPVRAGEGPLNLASGYRERYPLNQFVASDLTYSPGRFCSRKLSALVESNGLGICKERGLPIPEKTFGAIDFNGNGVIDSLPVDIYDKFSVLRKWLWKDAPEEQKDDDEWDAIRFRPDAFSPLRSDPVGIHCGKNLIWGSASIASCIE